LRFAIIAIASDRSDAIEKPSKSDGMTGLRMLNPSRERHLVLLPGFEGDQGEEIIAKHLSGDVLYDGELRMA
jgi:hypothetical protein